NQLLVRVAKELKCSKVFVGESSTRLAVKILTNVALGRGAHLSLDVGFCDSRDGAIKVLRPMRDFTNKEVAFYNFFNKLEPVVISSLGTKSALLSVAEFWGKYLFSSSSLTSTSSSSDKSI
ncbi:unnamed protein product, partial [Timema podura]|nr:unnamed protein product [Timema podura]